MVPAGETGGEGHCAAAAAEQGVAGGAKPGGGAPPAAAERLPPPADARLLCLGESVPPDESVAQVRVREALGAEVAGRGGGDHVGDRRPLLGADE